MWYRGWRIKFISNSGGCYYEAHKDGMILSAENRAQIERAVDAFIRSTNSK